MSDRVINFNDIKNKAKEKDVDKFEDYIYSLYYDMAEGRINMADFSRKIMAYVEENNISQDKLMDIQKKFLERYGFDSSMIEDQFKMAGIDINKINSDSARIAMSFKEKYKDRIKVKSVSEYFIKNDKNNLKILLENDTVVLISEKNIDLTDNELNEFLCSYKKVIENKNLTINICENSKNYNY